MRSGNFPWKLLGQLIFVLVVNFTDAGNLDFYQDAEPELPEDITYEQIAKYLESQNHRTRQIQRPGMVPILPWTYAEYLDYGRHREKILEALLENPAILEALEKAKMKNRADKQWPRRYDIPEDYYNANSDVASPFINVNPPSDRLNDYSNAKIPYVKTFFDNEKPYYSHDTTYPFRADRPNIQKISDYPVDDVAATMKLQQRIVDLNLDRMRAAEKMESSKISKQREPDFTFKMNDPKINERDTFAIGPNDPRFYEDDEIATSATINEQTTLHEEIVSKPMEESFTEFVKINDRTSVDDTYGSEDNAIEDKFSFMEVIMPDRRSERDSITVSSARIKNGDVYFIAIVAGCSAAAMFALVLITLTWCRIHRGAKAAADIEYPAYGVTGPNKDISPSGDQRLAHSAQMYHFQHQKQQIIAMESRTAASRDPGSVSEAESDEENEEGDYTVYECPGLASTGEMEVKNPMFHDDPTPATPTPTHKEEDHM